MVAAKTYERSALAKELWFAQVALNAALDAVEQAMQADETIANTVGQKHECETIPEAFKMCRKMREIALRLDRCVGQ